jgi:hypothetical protein
MTIRGEITVTPEMYRAASSILARKVFRWYMIAVGAIFFLFGLLAIICDPDIGLVAGPIMVILGLVLAIYAPRRALSRGVRSAQPMLGRWTYAVGEDGINIASTLSSGDTPWTTFTGVADHPDVWLLYLPFKNTALFVFKAAFTEADRAAVAERFRISIGRQPTT